MIDIMLMVGTGMVIYGAISAFISGYRGDGK